MKGKFPRGLTLFILFALTGGQAGEAVPLKVKVEGFNGDLLSGELLTGQKDEFLINGYWLETPLRMAFTDIRKYFCRNPEGTGPEGATRLTFRNGNRLEVERLQSEGWNFSAEMSWGDVAEIPGDALKSLGFYDSEDFLHHGPLVKNSDTGEAVRRSVLLPEPGREWRTESLKFPNKFLLELEIELEAADATTQISLFDWQRRLRGALLLEISASQLSTAWYQRNLQNGRMSVQNWSRRLAWPSLRHRVRIYYDKAGPRIVLMLNGAVMTAWEGPEVEMFDPAEPLPINFRFVSGGGRIHISAIRLMDWNGEVPALNQPLTEDLLLFKGGKTVTGSLQAMTDRNLTFLPTGAGKEETFSRSEVLEVLFARKPQPLKPENPDSGVRLYFPGPGSPLEASELIYADGKFSARIATGGTAFRLPVPLRNLGGFERIEGETP